MARTTGASLPPSRGSPCEETGPGVTGGAGPGRTTVQRLVSHLPTDFGLVFVQEGPISVEAS